MNAFHINIEKETVDNVNYRKVLYTSPTKRLQLVVMSLKPNEEIGNEVHDTHDQFIRVERGIGQAIINDIHKQELKDGSVIIIPAGTWHNIKNISKDFLKLYTLYSPAEHRDKLIQLNKPLVINIKKN
jgi:mannose-6-phosphate isomerase-like protein (cupin superfamily)